MLQILFAYLYHVIFIALGYLLMKDYPVTILYIFFPVSILYMIYWIVLNRKGYMPWSVYLNFSIGTFIEMIFYGRLPPRIPGTLAVFDNFIFWMFIVIFTVVLGIANLILWLIDKLRHKKRTKKSDFSRTERSETAK